MQRGLISWLIVFVLGSVLCIVPRPAKAAPLNCTVSSGGFTLSQYDVFSTIDTTTILADAVQYTCNKNSTAISIALGPSMGTNDYAPRKMLQAGEDPMNYYISLGGFTSACGGGSGVVWGDSAVNNNTISYIAVSGRRDVPNTVVAFGCIPHGQNLSSGGHIDSVRLTVSF